MLGKESFENTLFLFSLFQANLILQYDKINDVAVCIKVLAKDGNFDTLRVNT